MRITLCIGVLLAASALLAAACDDGSQQPVLEELTAEEELLQSMVLTGREVGDVFPGLTRTVLGPQRDLIQKEQRDAGVVATWSEGYGAEGREDVSIGLQLYDTDDNAEQEFSARSQQGSDLDVGDIGDEAQGVSYGSNGCSSADVLFRVDRVLALLRANECGDGEVSEEVVELAESLAEKIAVVIES